MGSLLGSGLSAGVWASSGAVWLNYLLGTSRQDELHVCYKVRAQVRGCTGFGDVWGQEEMALEWGWLQGGGAMAWAGDGPGTRDGLGTR